MSKKQTGRFDDKQIDEWLKNRKGDHDSTDIPDSPGFVAAQVAPIALVQNVR